MTQERQFRIVGERKGIDWRGINQMQMDTLTGEWSVQNDITRSQADYIVDQQDFRESMRQAFAEQFFEMLGKLPPDMSIALMDLAFDMVDLPGKDEVVKRIRQINGQSEDGEETEETIAKRETDKAASDLDMRARLAKVGLDEAKSQEIMAKVQGLGLGSKEKALQIAQLVELLLPLAPAADRLLSTSQPPEETANVSA